MITSLFKSWIKRPVSFPQRTGKLAHFKLAAALRAIIDPLEQRVLLSFTVPASYPTGTMPVAATSADLNGDGVADLIVANESAGTVSVLFGNGDGTFRPKNDFATGADPVAVAVGDFNGDGKPDILTANLGANTVSILFGIGGGAFARTDLATGAKPVSLAVGDFNHDGKLDFAVAAMDAANDYAKIFIGNGNGTFLTPSSITTDSAPRFFPLAESMSNIAVGDFNGDGNLDIVAANNKDQPLSPRGGGQTSFPPGTASVLLGAGNGNFQPPVNYPVGASPRSIAVGDFNGDGHLDFAVANAVSANVQIFPGTGAGAFSAPTTYIPGNQPFSLVAADFNGDGRMDLATSGAFNSVTLLNGQANGFLQIGTSYVGMQGELAIGDFNGDAHPDLAIVAGNPLQSSVGVELNSGNGTLLAPFITNNPGVLLASQTFADFNGDGIPDLATTGITGNVEVDLGVGDGFFGDRTTLTLPGSVGATDINNDGTQDLLIGAAGTAKTASVYLNSPGYDNRAAGALALKFSAPRQITAGATFPLTVTAVDALGNPVPAFHGTVDIDILQPGATSLGRAAQYDFTPADNGTHIFNLTLNQANSITLSAFALGVPSVSVTSTVVPAPTSRFVFTAPATTVAGAPFSFTIAAEDRFGNLETAYGGTVHFGALASDTQATLPADYTFLPSDSGVHTFTATLTKSSGASSPIIIATDIATGVNSFVNLFVAPLAASSLSVSASGQPLAGGGASVTVTGLDIYGNSATRYAGTVHLVTSDAQAVLPADYTFAPIDQGIHSFIVTFKTAGTQSVSVTDAANGFTATQSGIVVIPGFPTVWLFNGLTSGATAGSAQTFTLSAFDAFGNLATNYTGAVHFSSSDLQAGLPANYTFNPADAGSHTFAAAFKTAGPQSLTVTDTVSAAFTATVSAIAVAPGAAASFVLAGLPTATTAGVTQTFTVTARDAFGNIATGYTGTVAFSSTDPLASLPTNYTFTAADAGVHPFAATLKKAAVQSLTVKDASLPTLLVAQASINVSAAALDHFAITGPASVTTGVGFNITASAVDAFGNVVTGYRGKVHFSTTATNAGLPSDFTYSNNDNGVHVFSVTLNTLGFQTVKVLDTTNSSVVGNIVINVLAQTSGGAGGGGGGGGTGGGASLD